MFALRKIDGLFLRISEEWTDPPDRLVALLLLRTHAAYRVASLLTVSGTPTDAYPLLRSVLETLLIQRGALAKIWLSREDSKEAKAAVRDKFKPSKIKKVLALLNSELESQFDALYERCIDLGAQPTEPPPLCSPRTPRK